MIAFLCSGLLLAGAGCTSVGPDARGSIAVPAAPAPAPSPPVPRTKGPEVIYLTFDADMTPAMLARLRKGEVKAWYDPLLLTFLRSQKVPATIFMTGMFAETYPDLARSLTKDPLFSIQNHSYDHAGFERPCYDLRVLTSDDQRRQEIEQAQRVLARIAGARPTLFRYPGLCRNAHDDGLVRALGLGIDDGTLVGGDAYDRDPQRIVLRVLKQAAAGSDILLHLGGPNAPATAQAVIEMVPILRAKGFVFAKRG